MHAPKSCYSMSTVISSLKGRDFIDMIFIMLIMPECVFIDGFGFTFLMGVV